MTPFLWDDYSFVKRNSGIDKDVSFDAFIQRGTCQANLRQDEEWGTGSDSKAKAEALECELDHTGVKERTIGRQQTFAQDLVSGKGFAKSCLLGQESVEVRTFRRAPWRQRPKLAISEGQGRKVTTSSTDFLSP